MSFRELIYELIGVDVESEDFAEIRRNPRDFVESEEDLQFLKELIFLLDKSEEGEEQP